jgi:hypothetical protein
MNIDEIQYQLSIEVNKQIEKIISLRFKEKTGLELAPFEELIELRFHPFMCEVQGENEKWYYNDGSIKGLHICTIKKRSLVLHHQTTTT